MKLMSVRDLIDASGTAAKETRKHARQSVQEAGKQSRRQVTRGRIAAAKARTASRTKAGGISRKAVGAAGAAGLAAGYFLDPHSGRRRRQIARDKALSLIRRGAEPSRREPAPNDQALAERVKTQIFQPVDAPKGSVKVNVERGVVYLRGEVGGPEEIRELVKQAGAVDGVAGVENLLHTA